MQGFVKTMRRPPEPKKKIKETKPPVYRYDAFKFQRVMLLIYKTMDGIFGWEVQSFTNNKDVWHPSIDTEGKQTVTCDCPNFQFKLELKAKARRIVPSVLTPQYQCKHIKTGILTLKMAGYLKDVPTPDLTLE